MIFLWFFIYPSTCFGASLVELSEAQACGTQRAKEDLCVKMVCQFVCRDRCFSLVFCSRSYIKYLLKVQSLLIPLTGKVAVAFIAIVRTPIADISVRVPPEMTVTIQLDKHDHDWGFNTNLTVFLFNHRLLNAVNKNLSNKYDV